jgi:hypothetical protein
VVVFSALLALSVWDIGWLESHGIFVVGIFLDRSDVAWLVRPAKVSLPGKILDSHAGKSIAEKFRRYAVTPHTRRHA